MDTPADFQTDASTTHDLTFESAAHRIAYYWALQVPNPVAFARYTALLKTPTEVLNQLRTAMAEGKDDLTTLILYNERRTEGHSVTPYAIHQYNQNIYHIYVYDNNYPNDHTRFVEVNIAMDTWMYAIGAGIVWQGNAATHSLGAIPIAVYDQQPVCAWCNQTTSLQSSAAMVETWLAGSGHLLIRDPQSRRIGYDRGQFFHDIPDAFGSYPPSGVGNTGEPVYYLPAAESYRIAIAAAEDEPIPAEPVMVSQFGTGYALSVNGVMLDTSAHEQVTVGAGGTLVAYRAGTPQEVTLKMALNEQDRHLSFELGNVDVDAAHTLTVTADAAMHTLVLDNQDGGNGEYTLKITYRSAAGAMTFVYDTLALQPGDVQTLDFGELVSGDTTVTLFTDDGHDGSIDETRTLNNQTIAVLASDTCGQ